MGETVKLGRILGVKVGVNWSVLVVFVLVTWWLAATVFPGQEPGHPGSAYWTAGLITAALFFLCLLAHELSHAIVARRTGVAVDGITLWLLGGVTRLDGDPPSAGAELRVAGVGPLVSLCLGGLFSGVAVALDAAGAPGLLVAMPAWLGAINILLAVFNSVPATPLDGGRVLRAIVWWRTGDRTRSILTTAMAGQGFGWLLVTGGTMAVLLGSADGLWFALIGWFLILSSTAEIHQAQLQKTLSGMCARLIAGPPPEPVPASLTVARFLDQAPLRHHSAFPLTIGEPMPIGLVTLDRLRRVPPSAREAVRLRDVMYPLDQVAVVRPDTPAAELVASLTAAASRHALVLDDGRLVGLVSPADLERAIRRARLNRPRENSHNGGLHSEK